MQFSAVCYSDWALFLNTIQVRAKRFGWTVTAQIKAELPDPFNDAILLTGWKANEGAAVNQPRRKAPKVGRRRLRDGELTRILLNSAFSFGGRVTVGMVAVGIDLSTCS